MPGGLSIRSNRMPIGPPRIERCGAADAPVIAEVGRTTFAETYADQTDPAEMKGHLDETFDPAAIGAELSEPDSAFFVARCADAVAGFVKVNRGAAQTELGDPAGVEIESLYVLRAFQGQGIGRLLLNRALEEARDAGAEYVWLGVWERNSRARQFWKSMGFVEFGSHPFRFGTVMHTDLMMRRELQA